MTIEELYIKLQESGISKSLYYLHGLYGATNDDEKLSLVMRKGKYTLEYKVYYKEKGTESAVRIFTIEDEACQYMYKQLSGGEKI
jgi:hypothetical protein